MCPTTANLDTPAPLRILLVEDDEFDVAVFRRAFRKSQVPCEIIRCRSAEEAIQGLEGTDLELDLVVTDHKLPGMTGLEMSKVLLAKKPPFAVVLLTGGGSEEVAIESLKAGVHDYIVKDSTHEYLALLPLVLPQAVRRQQDHIARKKAERELRASQDAALESRRRRLLWLEETGVEIRQTLNGVQRELTKALEDLTASGMRQSPLHRVQQGQQRLVQLFDSFLEASKHDPQQEERLRRSFDLGEAIRIALEALTLPPEAPARDLFYALSPEVPERVFGDREQLHEIIVRLVDSLIRQTDAGEVTVQVGLHEPAGCLRFDIGGNCLIMPAKNRQRLMAAFDLSAEETMAGAFSVELMECRDLARRMGGSIWVEAAPSAQEDDQTLICFSAELPPVIVDEGQTLQEPSGETSWWETSGEGSRIGRQRLEHPVLEVDRHPAQVLLVTANPIVSHVVGRMVEQLGCRFVPVENGNQALNALEREPFDLVLTALDLPQVGGLELTRRIRQDGRQVGGRRLPIVAMGVDTAHLEPCRQAGMDGLIRRPLTLRRVEKSVRRALRDRTE